MKVWILLSFSLDPKSIRVHHECGSKRFEEQ